MLQLINYLFYFIESLRSYKFGLISFNENYILAEAL